MTGVNTLFAALLQNEEFKNANFEKLDGGLAGGMATQTETIRKWKEVTGTNLYEGYGLTETSPVLSLQPLNDTFRPGWIGVPVQNTKMRIVDDDGKVLPIGDIGEI